MRRGAREVAIGLATYGAYLMVGRTVLRRNGRARADHNARRLAAFEERLGLNVEPRVQALALRAPKVVHVLNAGYAVANVMLSVGWLARLYRVGDPAFVHERRAAVVAYLGALPAFWMLPTAPPRTLDGYVDTIAVSGIDIEHPFLLRFYNPVAAMPSLHVAFAVLTASGISARPGSPLRRVAWSAYAPAVSLVVVATGNHLVLDCCAGAVLGATARALTR